MKRRGFFAAITAFVSGLRAAPKAAASITVTAGADVCAGRIQIELATWQRWGRGFWPGEPLLTPREKAYGLPHSNLGVKSTVGALVKPMRVSAGPSEHSTEVLFAWHVEQMDDGSYRLYLAGGGFHSYSPNAFVAIHPDGLMA